MHKALVQVPALAGEVGWEENFKLGVMAHTYNLKHLGVRSRGNQKFKDRIGYRIV